MAYNNSCDVVRLRNSFILDNATVKHPLLPRSGLLPDGFWVGSFGYVDFLCRYHCCAFPCVGLDWVHLDFRGIWPIEFQTLCSEADLPVVTRLRNGSFVWDSGLNHQLVKEALVTTAGFDYGF